MMDSTFFYELFNLINIYCDNYINALPANLGNYLKTAVTIFLVIFITLYGIRIIFGQSKAFAYDFLIAMFCIAAVTIFATNMADFNNNIGKYLRDLPNATQILFLKDQGGTALSISEILDEYSQIILKGINKSTTAASNADQVGVSLVSLFSAVLIYMSWILMSVVMFFSLAAMKVFSSILVALGPFFILSTLFVSTRGLFGRWLSLVLSINVFGMLIGAITVITYSVSIDYFNEFEAKADEVNFTKIAPSILTMLATAMFYIFSAKLTQALFATSGSAFGNLISDKISGYKNLVFGGSRARSTYYNDQPHQQNSSPVANVRTQKVRAKNIVPRQ